MSADGIPYSPTAADLVVVTPQPDDSGAGTADRFEWQAAMATADVLACYLRWLDSGGPGASVLCEVHEDWVLIDGDDAELVSAKQFDSAFGAYTTYNQLIGKGGIGHLYRRWSALGRLPACRLTTTPGLGAGPAQDLEKTITWLKDGVAQTVVHEQGVDGVINAFGTALEASKVVEAGFGDNLYDDTTDFLKALTLDHSQPSRHHLSHAAPSMFAAAVAAYLKAPDSTAPAIWEAVLTLTRARMRAAGPTRSGGLPKVLPQSPQPVTGKPISEVERRYEARLLTMDAVDVAVKTAISHPLAFRPLPRLVRLSNVAIKMSAGRCTPNSIERAEDLRQAYDEYWRDRRSTDPAARAEQVRVGRAILARVDEAADLVCRDDQPWGRALWRELRSGLSVLDWAPHIDPDLLLGGLSSLANECKVWFSQPFLVEVERQKLMDALGADQ